MGGQSRPWRPSTRAATGPTASSSPGGTSMRTARSRPSSLSTRVCHSSSAAAASPANSKVAGRGAARPRSRLTLVARASRPEESRPPEKLTTQGGRASAEARTSSIAFTGSLLGSRASGGGRYLFPRPLGARGPPQAVQVLALGCTKPYGASSSTARVPRYAAAWSVNSSA